MQLTKLDGMIQGRRDNAVRFKEAMSWIQSVEMQTEIGESSWFGFGILLTNGLEGKRKEIISALTSAGIETRPIVAGNFTKNPVIAHIPHEIRGTLDSADYIDRNGFFVGNNTKDMTEEIELLKTNLLISILERF